MSALLVNTAQLRPPLSTMLLLTALPATTVVLQVSELRLIASNVLLANTALVQAPSQTVTVMRVCSARRVNLPKTLQMTMHLEMLLEASVQRVTIVLLALWLPFPAQLAHILMLLVILWSHNAQTAQVATTAMSSH